MVVKKKQDYTYWTDQVVEDIRNRVKNSATLKKVVKERGYIVYDEKTPSGKIHIGAGRGWVLHDMIAKSLRDQGLKGRFILSSDDMDPMDGLFPDLKERFQKFMGIPLRNVPSPVKGHDSYADYFFSQCTELFDEWNIEAELESTGERYIRGDFNRTIKTALDNADKIQNVYKKIYGKAVGAEKLPFNPICEKCGKIGTTAAFEWNPESEIVSYSCKADLVKWARGCGHKGEISPYNGNGKLPWKIEWAAKWPTVGVVAETAGKDHFTKGGSRTVAIKIACEIFNYPPPWPSTCDEEGKAYEFFLVEGKKMSTSKGIGISFAEISKLVPPEILRFLIVKTRPETTVDFKEEHIPMIDNEFARHERIYYGDEKSGEREEINARRVYELTVGKVSKKRPARAPFEKLIEIMKIAPEKEKEVFVAKKLKELGYNATARELKYKMPYVEVWIKDFEKEAAMEVRLVPNERKMVKEIIAMLEKENSPDKIQTDVFEIIKGNGMNVVKGFKLIYNIILNSDRGPRLGPYVLERGKDEIIKKLKAAL